MNESNGSSSDGSVRRASSEFSSASCRRRIEPDALQVEIDRVRKDEEFATLLQALVDRDKEILDRLAE